MEENPDIEWVRACQAGDADAFQPIVLRNQKRIYNLALRMLRDPAEAEDLTQEAFVAAFEQIGSFRGESAFSTWLYRIAVRRALNRIRDMGRRPLAHASSIDDPPPDGSPPLDPPDPSPGPDVIHERRETRVALERGLLELSADFRMVLILREMQGLSYEEIAEIVGVEAGTVKSRLHRARLALAEQCRSALGEGRNAVR